MTQKFASFWTFPAKRETCSQHAAFPRAARFSACVAWLELGCFQPTLYGSRDASSLLESDRCPRYRSFTTTRRCFATRQYSQQWYKLPSASFTLLSDRLLTVGSEINICLQYPFANSRISIYYFQFIISTENAHNRLSFYFAEGDQAQSRSQRNTRFWSIRCVNSVRFPRWIALGTVSIWRAVASYQQESVQSALVQSARLGKANVLSLMRSVIARCVTTCLATVFRISILRVVLRWLRQQPRSDIAVRQHRVTMCSWTAWSWLAFDISIYRSRSRSPRSRICAGRRGAGLLANRYHGCLCESHPVGRGELYARSR